MEDKIKYVWGVDISLSNTGVTIFEQNDADEIKCVLITSIDTSLGRTHGLKLKILADRLIELKNKYYPFCISSEKGFYRFADATAAIFKAHGILHYIMSDVELVEYSPMSVKKGIVGKGNSKKEEVRDYILKNCNNRFGEIVFNSLDESDSFSVILYHFKKIGVLKWLTLKTLI